MEVLEEIRQEKPKIRRVFKLKPLKWKTYKDYKKNELFYLLKSEIELLREYISLSQTKTLDSEKKREIELLEKLLLDNT